MPSTSDLLLQWDRRRARSQQKELGWSEVGGCRRRAGYRLAGTEPTNPSGSIQAVMGTAIDEAINSIAAELGISHQQSTEFLGIAGHFDRLESSVTDNFRDHDIKPDTVVDTKTVGTDRWLEHIEINGAPQGHQYQVHGYAAGLLMMGYPIRYVRIDYLARDTGREWSWVKPYDPMVTKAAVEWLTNVKRTPVEMLPRDFEPDSAFCRSCPFERECWGGAVVDKDPRSVIHVEDPDTARYARELKDARGQIEELKARAKRLAGILDAVSPPPGDRSIVQAGDLWLDWRPGRNDNRAIYFVAPSKIKGGQS